MGKKENTNQLVDKLIHLLEKIGKEFRVNKLCELLEVSSSACDNIILRAGEKDPRLYQTDHSCPRYGLDLSMPKQPVIVNLPEPRRTEKGTHEVYHYKL